MTDKGEGHFDLEKAISSWSRFVRHEQAISADDADELETHLRDEIDALTRGGLDQKAAFGTALELIGDYATVGNAYRSAWLAINLRQKGLWAMIAWSLTMIGSYTKVTLRNLRKQPGFALLNITGLSVGIASLFLIALFVRSELSYDAFHSNADRIFRINREMGNVDELFGSARTASAVGPALQEEYSGVREVVRLMPIQADVLIRRDGQPVADEGLLFADPSVFDVFSYPIEAGDPATALTQPASVVLTRRAAQRHFADSDPVGQTLTMTFSTSYAGTINLPLTVTGVVSDPPANSHLRFNFLISMETVRRVLPPHFTGLGAWLNNVFFSYVLLEDGYTSEAVAGNLPALVEKNLGSVLRQEGLVLNLSLQPVRDIHLHSDLSGELVPSGNLGYVYIFTAIALFILVVACINYVNLATSRYSTRAREVGMRKALGARRSQLIRQFIGESLFTAIISLLLGVGLVALLLPAFNTVSGFGLRLADLGHGSLWLAMTGVVLFVGVLAGLYPALFLSSFRPVNVLKGGASGGPGFNRVLRKSLVVFQFATSIVLLIGTAVIRNQLEYVQEKGVGYEREQVVAVPIKDRNMWSSLDAMRDELLAHPDIVAVSAASGLPMQRLAADSWPVRPDGKEDEGWWMHVTMIDHEFASTMGIEIVNGRNLSRSFATDAEQGFLLNEAAVRALGWEDPIGRPFTFVWFGDNVKRGTVVGVVKDYHFESLHTEIEPLVLHVEPSRFNTLAVRLRENRAAAALDHIEETWSRFDRLSNPDPGHQNLFEFTFLDEDFALQYSSERRLAWIVSYFTALAIVIACLGLFGLAAYAAERRKKEIGVRKVLGASASGILALLTREFLLLVGIAFLIASPIAYLITNRWLDSFAYRTQPGLPLFLMAGVVALTVAIIAVGYQAARAAMTDPIRSLRYE